MHRRAYGRADGARYLEWKQRRGALVRKLRPKDAKRAEEFSRQLYRAVSVEDLLERRPADPDERGPADGQVIVVRRVEADVR